MFTKEFNINSSKANLQEVAKRAISVIEMYHLTFLDCHSKMKQAVSELKDIAKRKKQKEDWVYAHPIVTFYMVQCMKIKFPKLIDNKCQEIYNQLKEEVNMLATLGEAN